MNGVSIDVCRVPQRERMGSEHIFGEDVTGELRIELKSKERRVSARRRDEAGREADEDERGETRRRVQPSR